MSFLEISNQKKCGSARRIEVEYKEEEGEDAQAEDQAEEEQPPMRKSEKTSVQQAEELNEDEVVKRPLVSKVRSNFCVLSKNAQSIIT